MTKQIVIKLNYDKFSFLLDELEMNIKIAKSRNELVGMCLLKMWLLNKNFGGIEKEWNNSMGLLAHYRKFAKKGLQGLLREFGAQDPSALKN